jgi:hypothetical protein
MIFFNFEFFFKKFLRLLYYMSSEIIQSVAYDNYDDFQHVNFIFSWNFISLFWELFNDETDVRVPYLSMKEGRLFCFVLFCFVVMRSTEQGCFKSGVLCVIGKLLLRTGCMGLVPWRLDFAVQKFLNIEWFLHWKLN